MKIKLYKLTLFITALFIYGCTSSDDIEMDNTLQDNVEMQNVDNNTPPIIGRAEFMKLLKEKYNSVGLNKKGNTKGDKPYWAAEYSWFFTEQGQITGAFLIPGTDLVYIYDYPINGEDRIHVKGDWGHMTWNIKQPKVFIYSITTGLVVYSNWCEENRTGFFKENLSGLIREYSFGTTDETNVWRIGVGPIWNPDSHGNVHIRTTLTDGQNSEAWVYPTQGEDCRESTTQVDFEVMAKVKNGHISIKVVLDGETYEGDLY